MKARTVKGLHRGDRFDDAAERIVRVRLKELCALAPEATDPAASTAQHDLRIAAKRLRYVLDVAAPCFGPYAPEARKRVKRLQTVLGALHDTDVLLERVGGRAGLEPVAERLRADRAAQHAAFLELWRDLQREGFAARLRFAIGERPEPPAENHISFTGRG